MDRTYYVVVRCLQCLAVGGLVRLTAVASEKMRQSASFAITSYFHFVLGIIVVTI
mgnify:CR=1 FL=1